MRRPSVRVCVCGCVTVGVCVNDWNWFWLRILPRCCLSTGRSWATRKRKVEKPVRPDILWLRRRPSPTLHHLLYISAEPPPTETTLKFSNNTNHQPPAPLFAGNFCASIHFNNKFQQINQNVTEAVWNFQVAGATTATVAPPSAKTSHPKTTQSHPKTTTRGGVPIASLKSGESSKFLIFVLKKKKRKKCLPRPGNRIEWLKGGGA